MLATHILTYVGYRHFRHILLTYVVYIYFWPMLDKDTFDLCWTCGNPKPGVFTFHIRHLTSKCEMWKHPAKDFHISDFTFERQAWNVKWCVGRVEFRVTFIFVFGHWLGAFQCLLVMHVALWTLRTWQMEKTVRNKHDHMLGKLNSPRWILSGLIWAEKPQPKV